MSNDNMGNLEKLGILVIVILVVVVGVVAITPSETLFPESGDDVASLDGDDAVPELEPRIDPADRPVWPADDPPSSARKESMTLADWLKAQDLHRPSDAPISQDPGTRPAPRPIPKLEIERPPVPAPRPTPAPAPRTSTYTVQSGDTLSGIARELFGSSRHWKKIAALNPDVEPSRLRVGQALRVPGDLGQPAAPAPRPPRSDGPVAGEGAVHVVEKGETLSSIAARYLGSAGLYRRIVDANKDTLPDPDRLKVGARLRIPGASSRSSNVSPRPAPAPRPASGGRVVSVEKGDSLSTIAERELGSAKHWNKIYQANRDVISDPDRLQVGVELRIP